MTTLPTLLIEPFNGVLDQLAVDAAVAERGEAKVFFDWSDALPEPNT